MMSGGVSSSAFDSTNVTRTKTLDTLYLIWESEDGSNLLTSEKLEFIQGVEQSVLDLSDFGDYCQLVSAGQCDSWVSVTVPGAIGSLVNADGTVKPESEWDGIISSTWCSGSSRTALSSTLVDKYFSCDNSIEPYKVTYLKSSLAFGGPLEGFPSVQQDTAEQVSSDPGIAFRSSISNSSLHSSCLCFAASRTRKCLYYACFFSCH